MGRSQESFQKKEVRKRKEKKRKEKEDRRRVRKENETKNNPDDMIAYVDEYGNITSTPPDPAEEDEVKAKDIEIGIPPQDTDHETVSKRTGILASFNHSKGYGFIRDSIIKENIFVHMTDMMDDLQEGDTVTFNLEKGPKGFSAINVKRT